MQGTVIRDFSDQTNPEDDWTSITAREERKKRQNRLNQRARRLRKAKENEAATLDQKPFRVQRWRVPLPAKKDEPVEILPPSSSEESEAQCLARMREDAIHYLETNLDLRQKHEHDLLKLYTHTGFSPPSWWSDPGARSHLIFPLSPDHILLHLVHFNVFRALTSNKALLSTRTILTKPADQGCVPLLPNFQDFCAGVTLLHPRKDTPIPKSLEPTRTQMTTAHSSWLNMFPFPRFRDNLIEWEGIFDAYDLCNDLWGEIYINNASPSHSSSSSSPGSSLDSEGDDVAARRRGLIVWSDPWDADGWEATPGFVEKWAWMLDGCEDLIASSNRWRAKRDEEPLVWNAPLSRSLMDQRRLESSEHVLPEKHAFAYFLGSGNA